MQHNTKPGAFNIFILMFTKSCKLKTSMLMCSPMRILRFREFHRPACCGTVAHQRSPQSGNRMQPPQTPPWIFFPVPSRPGQWEEIAPFPLERQNDDLSSLGSNCKSVAPHLREPGDLVAEFPDGAFQPRSYFPCSPSVYLGKAFLSIFADCSFWEKTLNKEVMAPWVKNHKMKCPKACTFYYIKLKTHHLLSANQ